MNTKKAYAAGRRLGLTKQAVALRTKNPKLAKLASVLKAAEKRGAVSSLAADTIFYKAAGQNVGYQPPENMPEFDEMSLSGPRDWYSDETEAWDVAPKDESDPRWKHENVLRAKDWKPGARTEGNIRIQRPPTDKYKDFRDPKSRARMNRIWQLGRKAYLGDDGTGAKGGSGGGADGGSDGGSDGGAKSRTGKPIVKKREESEPLESEWGSPTSRETLQDVQMMHGVSPRQMQTRNDATNMVMNRMNRARRDLRNSARMYA